MSKPSSITSKSISVASAVMLSLCLSVSAHADNYSTEQTGSISSAAPKEPKIFIVEQSLPDFLRQAARRNGFEITMTPRVRGTLKKMSLPLDMKELLEKISPQFDLKWHFQQKQLYVSIGSENSTRMIFLGATSMDDLKNAIAGAGLDADSYDMTFVEDSNSVIVNGPVSYIASVELIAEALGKNKAEKRDKLKIIRFGNVSNK